jgi:SAM-dependent methyltransferase
MERESRNARALHEGRKFSYDRVSAYRARFIDPDTGHFYPHLVRDRVCPVCGGGDHAVAFVKDGGTTVKCLGCTMVFLNPCFTDEALADYYKNLDTGQADITARESDFYREIYALGLTLLGERRAPPGTLLDVGCSSGFLLDNARARGWTTLGIELGLSEAALAKERGHEVYTKPLEQVELERPVDAITMWDVFEHVPDGRSLWKAIDRSLSRGGVVFMQIPNSDSLAARVMREHSRMHDGLEHVNLYNPHTIRLLADSVGYDVVAMRSVISEASVLQNFLHYEDGYFGSSTFDTKVLGLLDERTIHEHLLGYKLQVVLARRGEFAAQ